MWLLHFLPDTLLLYIVNTVLIFGLVCTFLTFFVLNRLLRLFPVLANYHLMLQIVSVVILATGLYFKGGYSTEMIWRERVEEVKEQLRIAENQSAEANKALEEEKEKKVKYIRGRTEYIKQFIDREIVKYDTKFMPGGVCEIPPEFIKAHNDAAEALKK